MCQEVATLDNIHELAALAREQLTWMDGWIVQHLREYLRRICGAGVRVGFTILERSILISDLSGKAELVCSVCVETKNRINSPWTSVASMEHRLLESAGSAAPRRHRDWFALC